MRPVLGKDDLGRLEVGDGGDDGRELRREHPERKVLTLSFDQAERSRIPEGRRPTVAQQHLVTGRQTVEVRQPLLHPPHDVLDGRTAVAGAEERWSGSRQSGYDLGSDLGRPRTEATINREQIGGDLDVGDGSGHVTRYRSTVGHGNQETRPEETT